MNPPMSFDKHNPNRASSDPASVVDATLRLIATLPAPDGLEDRMHATLRSAQASRPGNMLSWPSRKNAGSGWMRTAAAAAIAFVIAGGGWGVYSIVQPALQSRATAAPSPHPAAGGFSAAGAIRKPQTLNGPVVTHPAQTSLVQPQQPAQAKPARKPDGASGVTASGQSAAQVSSAQPTATVSH